MRSAQKRVTELEAEIQKLEAHVEKLSSELEDPELYTKPNGVARAKELGAELDRIKPQLERLLDEWAGATELVDTLGASGS